MSQVGTFSVRVVDDDGDPCEGVEVACKYGHLQGVENVRTDENGWAEFPILEQTLGSDVIYIHTIWVDGEEVLDDIFRPDDGQTFSFVRP